LNKKLLWIAAISLLLLIGLRFILADTENKYEIKSFTPAIAVPDCVSYDSLAKKEVPSICMQLNFEVEFYSDYSRTTFLGTTPPGTDGPKKKLESIRVFTISGQDSVEITKGLKNGNYCQSSECNGGLNLISFVNNLKDSSISGYKLSQNGFNFNFQRKYLKGADQLVAVLKFEDGKEFRRVLSL
jgi:hypothetical protein